ncbi:MAG: hypothetical protein MUC38_03330 [Cyclobacteriaceae bacterium]|jgi:hypothetical protein|nr:hypothetical protein [Cyclobacteriaceae bacterium]
MLVPFQELPAFARLWIYQTPRALTPHEEQTVAHTLATFCEQWQAHGQPLKTAFQIWHRHFVVLAVDENYQGASGCSIDGSVRTLKALQQVLGIDFFDRSHQAFWINDAVVFYPLTQLKALVANGTISGETLAFHNLVPSKEEFERSWKVPMKNSWLAKYLSAPALQP